MKYSKYLCQNTWTIGFVQNSFDDILNHKELKVKWIKTKYKDRWFADPFILDVDEKYIYLLVEEFYDEIFRGRLSKLIIDKSDYSVVCSEPFLELDTHLSFPFIKRDRDNIYIIPENYESGKSIEYTYNIKENKCEFHRILCHEPLMDAVLTNVCGDERLFSTCFPDHSILNEYKYNEENKLFEIRGRICFDNDIARNAGDWFMYKGNVYRPAQDCNGIYGKAFIIQKIEKEGNGYRFIDCRRIESPNKRYALGCHTFNSYKGVIVIDAKAKRFPILYAMYEKLRLIIYGKK